MHGPAVSGWLLVALCGPIGGYCLARMRGSSGAARSAAGGEALMALGMAAMAAPSVGLDLPGWIWPLYTAVFGAAALGALWSARHGGRHRLHHLVGSLAMVHMAAAMTTGAGHGGHPGGGLPLVTAALLAYYTVHVLRAGAGLVPAPASGPGPAPEEDSGPARACRPAMGLAMLTMLLAL
ncbi:DUF5134 domain-containing protein [Streptomyces sp. NPDC014894]|uniref:DUF5134 domain-containing protein n=1 Tax=Streptomyces sp. NPDC014894 TaxID=3364931 RepID=UPI0036FC26E0